MPKTLSVNGNSITVLRVLLSCIFVVASINQLFNLERTANKLNQARFKELAYIFGNPEITVIASGIPVLIAGIALMLGFEPKYTAIILAMVLILITITVQIGQMLTIGPLFKNIAILGGLLFFIMNNFNNKTTKQ
jgi:putative oxidoreductase